MNNYFFSVPIDGSPHHDEYIIFAVNLHDAQIMLTFFATEELDHSGWLGDDWKKFNFNGSMAELQKAKEQDKAGLGIYVSGEGWKIVSLDEMRASRYLD